MGVLVVAPVGVPFSWARVSYHIPWAGGLSVESRTSLAPLAEWLRSRGLDPRVLVFVPETVAAVSRVDPRSGSPVEGTGCLPDPWDVVEKGYRGFLEDISSCIAKWFYSEVDLGVEVVVTPGAGVFRYLGGDGSWRLAEWSLSEGLLEREAEPVGYVASFMLLALARALIESGDGGLEVHADLTHGLNYQTAAFYRVVMEAARVASAALGVEARVYFYNSEPSTPGAGTLNIWRVESLSLDPASSALSLAEAVAAARGRGGRVGFVPGRLVVAEADVAGRVASRLSGGLWELGPVLRAGKTAAAAVLAGAPLLLLQAGVWAGSLASGVVAELARRGLGEIPIVRVEAGSGRVRIVHRVALRYDQALAGLAQAALASYASRALELAGARVEERESSLDCREGTARVALASLAALRRAAGLTGGYLARILVENEVSNYEAAARSLRFTPDYELAGRALRECQPQEDKEAKEKALKGGIDLRVFIAHAGLVRQAITVEPDCGVQDPSGAVLLYYDPCLHNRLIKATDRILEKAGPGG